MTKVDKKRLGRGLSALLGDIESIADEADAVAVTDKNSPQKSSPSMIAIDLINANPDQPRRDFTDTDLEELADSIRQHGVIQPVLLRPDPKKKNKYQIVAGERRWRAAQRAQIHELPAIVRELDDGDVLELAIIENVQRVDLNPIEEASGYAQLIERFGHTQEALAKAIGKSRSHLANMMRLLNLPEEVRAHVQRGVLSAGHARTLINATDPVALAQRAIKEDLSVRQLETLARESKPEKTRRRSSAPQEKDADTRALEGDLTAAIGMRVSIDHLTADGAGELRIRYKSLDQLDKICQKLGE